MSFDPIAASQNIVDKYLRYVETTFFIKDKQYFEQFQDAIRNKNFFSKGPFLDVVDSFELSKSIREMVSENSICREFLNINSPKLPLDRRLYKHQEESIHAVSQGKNLVVTTGTGSGKTECFLLPIINHLLHEKEMGTLNCGIRAIIIYPMNALANDQMKRLRDLFRNYKYITFGSYTGETEEDEEKAIEKYKRLNDNSTPLENELISRKEMRNKPPHILITNYAMLEYLLIRPNDTTFFDGQYSDKWKFIVLDEAHTYSGATGIEVSMLLRRLKARLRINHNLQFILTSATLGFGEKDNRDILSFARSLCCGEYFDETSIIRARRVQLTPPKNVQNYPQNIYSTIQKMIEKDSTVDDISKAISAINPGIGEGQNLPTLLYKFIHSDILYYEIKNRLSSGAKSVTGLAEELDIKVRDLVSFIFVASKARKDEVALFDARYHMFIRMLEGAYITLSPNKRLFIEPYKTFQGMKVFKFSVCKNCGEIYLIGVIKPKEDGISYFEQPNDYDGERQYFVLKEDGCEYDIEENLLYTLCSKCGAIERSTNVRGHSCRCGSQYINKIGLVKVTDKKLNKCINCDAVNTVGSILRDFYLGQDAAASVIASSLYEELPSFEIKKLEQRITTDGTSEFIFEIVPEKIIEKKSKVTKQFLIFSDSRQQAAYFASYFDFTYHNLLRRRLIVDTLQEYGYEFRQDGVSIRKFAELLEGTYEKYGIFDKEDRKKEAWKTILYELFNDERNSPQNLGFLWFEYNKSSSINVRQFQNNESSAVINNLVDTFRKCGCIKYEHIYRMTEADSEYFLHSSGARTIRKKHASKDEYVNGWLSDPTHLNYRADYLKRVTGRTQQGSWEIVTINKFLEALWDHLLQNGLELADDNNFQLKIDCIRLKSPFFGDTRLYVCDKCGNITPFNANDVCTQYRCSGNLVQCDVDKYFKDNHYYRLYTELNIADMIIKEHTAQLNTEKAKAYQEEFVKKNINILSCSTTFEMGVDVGDLETVFMRNMPPSPANYIQRAGRAGRRADSAAYALTFCKLASHDMAFYNDPCSMINGRINPPIFKITNDKIIKRHINASALSLFFKMHQRAFNDVETFMLSQYYYEFVRFVKGMDKDLIRYLKDVLPLELHSKIERWLYELVEEEGYLSRIREQLLNDLNELEAARQEAISQSLNGNTSFYRADNLRKSILTIKGERIITFLSRKNIIPKYGFPVDSVELLPSIRDNSEKLRLSRDLSMAISEYAPGSEVIADGKIYTSRYIRRPVNDRFVWSMYDFGECSNPMCKYINTRKHTFDEYGGIDSCSVCGSNVNKKGTLIIPEYGFVAEEKNEIATTKKPEKTFHGEIFYVGDKKEANCENYSNHTIGGETIIIKSTSDDELMILNNSFFYVCNTCGYAILPPKNRWDIEILQEHKNPYGKDCKNQILKKRYLGHRFKTDVAYIQTSEYIEFDTAISVLYALLEGVSSYLGIERNDISGCIHTDMVDGNYRTGFVLYDSVPGGAGHVRRLGNATTNEFIDIIKKSYEVVDSCTCGGDEGECACYSCLCNYYNQAYHDRLNRNKARIWFKKMLV